MAKRVLITGASGLLGREIFKVFKNDSVWDVVGLAFSRVKEGLRKCDLTNPEDLKDVFKEFKVSTLFLKQVLSYLSSCIRFIVIY